MEDVVSEICMDADGGDKPYYVEVRERETDDVLFKGPMAGTRQMARHLASRRLSDWLGAVLDKIPVITTKEALENPN